MKNIEKNLYQASTYNPQIDLTFNQYLLTAEDPILFHTGDVRQVSSLVPQIERVLAERDLKYIFVSHFEADECGGLPRILERYPKALTICSEVTARQFGGFGVEAELVVKKPGERLCGCGYDLEFLPYPSEMHLWEGLLALEARRGIFFSGDMMIRHGKAEEAVLDSSWENEVESITSVQIPDPALLKKTRELLLKYSPRFVATGHGPCLRLA